MPAWVLIVGVYVAALVFVLRLVWAASEARDAEREEAGARRLARLGDDVDRSWELPAYDPRSPR
jgi:hypothetical protein